MFHLALLGQDIWVYNRSEGSIHSPGTREPRLAANASEMLDHTLPAQGHVCHGFDRLHIVNVRFLFLAAGDAGQHWRCLVGTIALFATM